MTMFNHLSFKDYRTIGLGTVLLNLLVQKVFRVNSKAQFMVHYTSRINMPRNIMIEKSKSVKTVFSSFASSNGLYINAFNGINIGANVMIASGVKLISANHDVDIRHKHVKCKPIVLKENVWIGANVIVLPSVTIGENSIVGAGSVVTKDIQSNVIVAGNPAKVIKVLDV